MKKISLDIGLGSALGAGFVLCQHWVDSGWDNLVCISAPVSMRQWVLEFAKKDRGRHDDC